MGMPLESCVDRTIGKLAAASGAASIANLDGSTLLCERAVMGGMLQPSRVAAGGGCTLYQALDDTVALNLARPADRDLLPALLESEHFDTCDQAAIESRIAKSTAEALVLRGRSMGLAIAAEREAQPPQLRPCMALGDGCPTDSLRRRVPRVIDLSSLWAGPLAAHLLWLTGAEVVKVESRSRPDGMRAGTPDFYALLNQGKASVAVSLSDPVDRCALLSMISRADIVIEAARPRALAHFDIDVAQIVRTTPGLVWVTITGHGVQGDAAGWVGFGDDCGVAGGLSSALRAASGHAGFVADAIADPLTGTLAALVAWEAWTSRSGGRFALAMSHVVAACLAESRSEDGDALNQSLRACAAAAGTPFPAVRRRPIGGLPAFGEHSRAYLS